MLTFSRCFSLFFHSVSLLAWLLVTFCLLRPMRLGRRAFCILSALFGALVAKNFWLSLLGGKLPEFDLSPFACDVIGGGFMFGVLLGGLSLMPPYRRWRLRAAVFALLAAILTLLGMYEARRFPDINQYTIEVEGLPPSFDGMRLVHLSDLHCSPIAQREHVRKIVAAINALNPDMVCVTGDLVDGSPMTRLRDLEPLADIRAKWGVFGCTGNHEFYSCYDVWRPFFMALGLQMLDNAHAIVTNGTDQLVIGGVIDPAGATKPMIVQMGEDAQAGGMLSIRNWPLPDVAMAFSNAPPDTFRILLAHRPINLAEHARQGVKLQLSGHTHGAAIWGLFWLPVAIMNDFHVKGFYRDEGIVLHVSTGAGQWIGYPMRLGVPPEITLLTLQSKEKRK